MGVTGLLDTRILAEAVTRAAEQLRAAHGELPLNGAPWSERSAKLTGRLQHLVNAIATGRATEAVFAELEKEETKKRPSGLNWQVSRRCIGGRNWTARVLRRICRAGWGTCRNYSGNTCHRLARCLEN